MSDGATQGLRDSRDAHAERLLGMEEVECLCGHTGKYHSVGSGGTPCTICSPAKCSYFVAKTEKINHPVHYGGDTVYEVIKVITAWGLGFCLGNAVKYIARAGRKSAETEIEDLEKARWYLDYEINYRKKLKATGVTNA